MTMGKSEKKRKLSKKNDNTNDYDDGEGDIDDSTIKKEANKDIQHNDGNNNTSKDDKNEVDKQGTSKRKRKRKRSNKNSTKEGTGENTAADDTQDTDIVHDDPVSRTIFIEGIPFAVSPDQVKEFFTSRGIHDIEEMRLPVWQDSGRLRGYGHIQFASKDSFQKALNFSGEYLRQRYLTIQPSVKPKIDHRPSEPPTPDAKVLFCNNLPYDAEEDDIAQVFHKYGPLLQPGGVRIVRNSVSRQSKGFAYIEYESSESARAAVKASLTSKGITVHGRRCRLDYDGGRIKGSYRTGSGQLYNKEVNENQEN